MTSLNNIKYSNNEIKSKREKVRGLLIQQSQNVKNGMISRIAPLDLELLFKLYDRDFLNNYIKENYEGKIKFSLSKRMTKAVGKTIYPKNLQILQQNLWLIEIRIGIDFIFKYNQINRMKDVAGIMTRDSLDVFQIVFEHELCHFVELILYGETNCGRQRFKKLAKSIFGHTKSCHDLPTNQEIAYHKYGFRAGDSVFFVLDGKTQEGFIFQINKRATVLVEDSNGCYVDQRGKRYSKFYVPLPHLKPGKMK